MSLPPGSKLAGQWGVKVVVTGATGNLGTSVLEALAHYSEVDSILGLARRTPQKPFAKTRFIAADVTKAPLAKLFQGADCVIHLAWQIQPSRKPEQLDEVNVNGSRRVFEAALAARVPHVVFASSVGAYSSGPKQTYVDEDWPTDGTPGSLYSQQSNCASKSCIPATWAPPLHAPWCAVPPAHSTLPHPPLDGDALAQVLQRRAVSLPRSLPRAASAATYHLRLQPASPSWLDMAMNVPLMDVGRARRELDWEPTRDATATIRELLEGIRADARGATAPLQAN